jgi:hypothetical protein
MYNDDLIAYLQPAPNRFNACEWRDVTGRLNDIQVESHRFTLRCTLPPGLYRGRIELNPGAFDMRTAMMPMIRVPDGERVLVGPWDLNHLENYMAIPMARTYVNGKLKGGLWFAMPGPQQIAEGWIYADFGFEAEEGQTELVLEFVEHDRERIDWGRVRSIELRKDDRQPRPLVPQSEEHPRIFLHKAEVATLRQRWLGDERFLALLETFRRGEFGEAADGGNSAGLVDLAMLACLLTKDPQIVAHMKKYIVDLCGRPTWSGRPDPLLMGGDNDRGVGRYLWYVGLAWEFLSDFWDDQERRPILGKAQEYLQKMYDFTVLQRGYMGCPTTDEHSLGTWNGVGVACMAFYDDLPIARKALPFFHGLFCDSLQLFPPGGKCAWATFLPFWLVRYLAAAHTFGGQRPELDESPFLDHLAQALLACFPTPNTQELQRGKRTSEYRYLTAFLNRYHPTDDIASIYQAFVDQEQKTAGDLMLTLFDVLYAPVHPVAPAKFSNKALLTKDIGGIICTSRGTSSVGLSFGAGLKRGTEASFHVMPHNREAGPLPMATLEVSVDGAPVLVNLNISTYGINSALTNTMCFEDGGVLTQGQYLNGQIGPESSGYLRRCLLNERFVYAHAVIIGALHPKFRVRRADRILVFDLYTGSILLNDSFEGHRPIRFATHLHCSGSVAQLGPRSYRLSGGQANLIAGIKNGDKGLCDEERGAIFATILSPMDGRRVAVEEPAWIPGYIYGLNGTPDQKISDAKFPHYRRWRLEAAEPVNSGAFLVALGTQPDTISIEREVVSFPGDAHVVLTDLRPARLLGCQCLAEAVLVDEPANTLLLIGARQLAVRGGTLGFSMPTDVELKLDHAEARATLFSVSSQCVASADSVKIGPWQRDENNPRSNCPWFAECEFL